MKSNWNSCTYLVGAASISLLLTVYIFPSGRRGLLTYVPSFSVPDLQENNQKSRYESYIRNGDLEAQAIPDTSPEIQSHSFSPGEEEEDSRRTGDAVPDIGNGTATSDDLSLSLEEWMKQIETRFEARRAILREGCSRLKDLVHESVKVTMGSRLFFSPKYNLTVCLNAKVGASTWKSNLFALAGNPRYSHVHVKAAYRMSSKKFFTKERLYSLMANGSFGVQVLVVRHPLERLVSAYRDKYNDGALSSVKRKGYFRSVIKEQKLRPDSEGKIAITFPQFLRHVVMQHMTKSNVNRHWRGFASNCSPCTFNYSHIMRVSTWEEDMTFLINKLNISEVKASNHLHSKSNKTQGARASYFSYYKGVDPELLKTIYKIYNVDFVLFNYTLPDFIQKAMEGS